MPASSKAQPPIDHPSAGATSPPTPAAEATAKHGLGERLPGGLVYVSRDTPGLTRVRNGHAFSYQRTDGKPLRNAAEIQRIHQLAIPPAYEDVWICPLPGGHLQATGR